jgi:hypothetical protein
VIREGATAVAERFAKPVSDAVKFRYLRDRSVPVGD